MNTIASPLYIWYEAHRRPLPWRETRDPYAVWVSEVILHQTRIAQGTGYYHRFLKAFPDVVSLARAPLESVMQVWAGLGYYRRAVNMHNAAIAVMRQMGGVMPVDYDTLVSLPGIGDYTASMISSVCGGERRAAVDGNVNRFVARYLDLPVPPDSAEGRKTVKTFATEIISDNDPGLMNNALMEFGALQCIPRNPDCTACPLEGCFARERNRVHLLPLKRPKGAVRTRHLHYLVFVWSDNKNSLHCLIKRRGDGDIWSFLYDFPCIETHTADSFDPTLPGLFTPWIGEGTAGVMEGVVRQYRHQLSHQQILAAFHIVRLPAKPRLHDSTLIPAAMSNPGSYPFPRLISRFLQEYLDGL